MANIRVDLTEPLLNGMDIKFKAPCDCTAITGMVVYAPDNDGNVSSQTFTFKDAHGNALTGLGNLFSKDALVKVMVDTDNSSAYIQNADTNKYLENKIANAGTKVTLSSSVTSTSTTTAANSYAVKQAYDKAVSAHDEATSVTTGTATLSCQGESARKLVISWCKAGRVVNLKLVGDWSSLSNNSSGYTFVFNNSTTAIVPYLTETSYPLRIYLGINHADSYSSAVTFYSDRLTVQLRGLFGGDLYIDDAITYISAS